MLATQRESGSAIKSFSADLADLSDTLRTSDGDLRKVLDGGMVASQELQTLIRDNRTAISALLANLLTSGQVTVARLDGLEQVLVTYPDNVAGGYTVVPGDGTSHFGLVLNAADPPVCTQGYERHPEAGAAATPATGRPTPTPGAPRRAAARPRSAAPRTPRRPRAGRPARCRAPGRRPARTGRTVTSRARPFRRRTSPGTTPPAAWPSASAAPR